MKLDNILKIEENGLDLIFGILMLNAFCVFNGLKSPVKLI